MNITILGKGYIGSALHKKLSTIPDHVVNVYARSELDYTDVTTIVDYIIKKAPGIIINASGYTGRPNVDACEDAREDTWYHNVEVPGMLGDICNKHNVNFIHVSSGCIYTGYDKNFTEYDQPNFGLLSSESSWYSKTKHAGELMLSGTNAHVFRIRMPFCETNSPRNVITKLRKYDNVIDELNSVTNVEDFCDFVEKYINTKIQYGHPGAVYNVVNPQPVKTSTITNMLNTYGIGNPRWQTITLKQLKQNHIRANRSNCVLSTENINKYNLSLPCTELSLDRCIRNMSHEYFTQISRKEQVH